LEIFGRGRALEGGTLLQMEFSRGIQMKFSVGTVRKLNTILLALSMFPIYGTGEIQAAPGLALTHVTVIDVTGGRAQEDMTVVVSDNLITALEPAPHIAVPQGARVIDGRGKYIIPGLWDMHVHVDDAGDWFFPLAVANGVTGLRAMGSSISQLERWRERRQKGREIMPYVLAAGPIVTGMVDDPDPRLVRVATRADAERAVDSLVRQGVDFIKVHDWLSRDAYAGIMARASSRGVPVAGHLPVAMDAAEVSAAGQRSIEHLGNAWGGILIDCSTEEAALKRELRTHKGPDPSLLGWNTDLAKVNRLIDTYSRGKAESLAALFARAGTWQTPTIYASCWLSTTPLDESFARDPRLKYLPASARSMMDEMVRDSSNRHLSAEQAIVRKRLYARYLEFIRVMRKEGVPFLAGTDALPFPPVFPGFSLHDELAKFVEAGFTPLEALQTATINPAKFLHATTSWGAVAVGKRADLVLLDADPLADIRNTTKIYAVLVNGRLIDSDQRKQLLAQVQAAADRLPTKL
jgi:Amidohydrolase family